MEKYDPDTKKAVGRGAFGVVFLYQRKSDRKEIIIKQITTDDLTTDQRKGVMNEIKLSKMFNHPNIVRYLEYFVEEKTFNIVMEYAPGGNLYDYLQLRHNQKMLLEEEEILKYFGQIVRALHHIHKHMILHRDMKTHNILLDRRKKVVKICDFGISKFLTQTNAMTTVGTAHYMSPEVVEGKSYNQKSDVWSLGCILYELITLRRAFDSESLSGIVKKVLRCEYSPMPNHYSNELIALVKEILNIEPSKRPDVEVILAAPILINVLMDLETDVGRIPCLFWNGMNAKRTMSTPTNGRSAMPKGSTDSLSSDEVYRTQSFTSWGVGADRHAHEQTSCVYIWGAGVTTPTLLDVQGYDQLITSVSVGRTKKLGLTTNGRVVSWETSLQTTRSARGFEKKNMAATLSPKIVGELSGSTIVQVCCGDRFIAVRSDRGLLMTWGSAEHGCLGHGLTNDISKARVVEDLVGCTVVQIACGSAHVMALTNEHRIYVWGVGSYGHLGLNDREERNKPTLLPLPSEVQPKSIICGPNYSFIITTSGTVYACGNNRDNKIGLLSEDELNTPNNVVSDDNLTFTKITSHPICDHQIVSIGTGQVHTAFVTASGLLITAGSNKNYQLGYQRNKGDLRPAVVDTFVDAPIHLVGCGDTFTVAVTKDNRVFSWGGGKHGRLGYESTGNSYTPCEVELDEAGLNIQAISVAHNTTILAGQVNNATLTPMNY